MKKLIMGGLIVVLSAVLGPAAAQVTVPREKVFHVADLPTKSFVPGFTNQAVTGVMAMMLFNHLEAGAIAPPHNHPSEQITYVVSGRLKMMVEDRVTVLGPGDVMVIPAHVVHGAEVLEDTHTIEAFGPPHQAFLDIAQ